MNTKEKVLIHKGMDMVRRMQFDEALETFDKAISLNPEITEAWNNRGVALFRLGRDEDALESYNRALSLDPQNLDALRNKGFVLRSMGRLDEALECYNSILKAGGDALDMEAMAAVLAGMGRPEEALQCMLQAIEIQPLERFEEEIEVLKGIVMQRSQQPTEGKE
jgi:tetratricopeptide (TPR) repeat protein